MIQDEVRRSGPRVMNQRFETLQIQVIIDLLYTLYLLKGLQMEADEKFFDAYCHDIEVHRDFP
jgi:hypothetical protein